MKAKTEQSKTITATLPNEEPEVVEYYDDETRDNIIDSLICSLISEMRFYKLPVGKTWSVTLSMEDMPDGQN